MLMMALVECLDGFALNHLKSWLLLDKAEEKHRKMLEGTESLEDFFNLEEEALSFR